jgi:hypothetical protein
MRILGHLFPPGAVFLARRARSSITSPLSLDGLPVHGVVCREAWIKYAVA